MTHRPDDKQGRGSFTDPRPSCRPLNIDFPLYTEGDEESNKELGRALINNLAEFQRSLTEAIQQNNSALFYKATHKVTVSLKILADQEFNEIIQELKEYIANVDKGVSGTPRLHYFHNLCDLIIDSLKKEFHPPQS